MKTFKLRDLDPSFRRHYVRMCPGGPSADCSFVHSEPQEHRYIAKVESLADAQGIWFDCPACTEKNGGPIGTHGVLVWFADRGVPPELEPKPRWNVVSGTNFDDLVLSPSILLIGGCAWHGFIGQNCSPGEVSTC